MTPLEAVQEGYDCFSKGDIAGLVALFGDNTTFTPLMGLEGKAPLVTPKGTFSREEMPAYFARLAEELEFTKWQNRQWLADGDTVVLLGRYEGRNKRTGKPFASEFVHVLTVTDGKAASFKEFTDTAAILEACA
jgi:uncharacterized protein